MSERAYHQASQALPEELETTEMVMDRVLDALGGAQQKTATGHMAICPAHPDGQKRGNASLHVTPGRESKIILYCFAGCSCEEIVSAAGIEMKDLFPREIERVAPAPGKPKSPRGKILSEKVYEIKDAEGHLVAQHVRREYEGGQKDFWWRTPKGHPGGIKSREVPLYGSEMILEILAGDPKRHRVVLTEGEKAADALRACGIRALATVTGSSTIPVDEVLNALAGLTVVLWPDNDDAGKKHMAEVAARLAALGMDARMFDWVDAPHKGDAAEHPAVVSRSQKDVKSLGRALAGSPPISQAPGLQEETPQRKSNGGSVRFAEVRSDFEQYLTRRTQGTGFTGLRTMLGKIDSKMGGLQDGESVVVGARTAVGKSIFVTQIGVNVARNHHRVAIYSTEMNKMLYAKRICHASSGIPDVPGEERPLTQREVERLRKAHEELEDLDLYIDDYKPDVDHIRRNIERDQPELVIVDHLHRMKTSSSANRYHEVGKISEELTALKTEYGIPIVMAAQLSRSLEYRNDKRPMLSDLMDASYVEADADWVLLLHRPGFYSEEIDSSVVNVVCAKARSGETFDATLHQIQHQAWLTEFPAEVYPKEEPAKDSRRRLTVIPGGAQSRTDQSHEDAPGQFPGSWIPETAPEATECDPRTPQSNLDGDGEPPIPGME